MKIEMARKIPGAKIMALGSDGVEYILRRRFSRRDDPRLFLTLARVRHAGEINMEHWRIAAKGEC